MKRIIHFHAKWLFLLLIGSFVLLLACEQDEIRPKELTEVSIPSCEENATEFNFFNYTFISNRNNKLVGKKIHTDEQKLLIQEKIQDIRADNCKERFVSSVVASLGYYVWDRATVGKKPDGTTVIFTASTQADADSIVSILVAEKKEAFFYYRFVKKDILEQLRQKETPELLEQLQFIESVDKELFGEKRPIKGEEDDFYLSGTLEESEIESRGGMLEISVCHPYVSPINENSTEQRSCPSGTWEEIQFISVPCGSGSGNNGDSGDGGSSCSFCDVDSGGGSSGGGGNSDDDSDSTGDIFDVNGDPFDTNSGDCSNPAACKQDVQLAIYKTKIINNPLIDPPFCAIQGTVSGRDFSVSDPYFHSEGRIDCSPETGGVYSLNNTYSRGSNISVTNNDNYTNCTVKTICGVAYWSWLLIEERPGLVNISTPGEHTEEICYDCRL